MLAGMHDLSPMFPLGAASLGLVAALGLWLMPSAAQPADDNSDLLALPEREPPPANLDELRARGPAGLDDLLARYDRLPDPDPAWEAAIDHVAGQRYARSSRLYWFTDLERAKQDAHRLHRPILALRMLGDLRDDLSCANSRLFRATLYANTELAGFLRENFVLYWSSERAVPKVTIDFGDGRKLVRTTTGNSAHYVLDEDGHVLDVLPGLYAAQVFEAELRQSLALAGQVRGMTDAQRIDATVGYHREASAAAHRAWDQVAGTRYIKRAPFLEGASPLSRAQRQTASKMIIEVPDLEAIQAVAPGEVPDDAAAWAAIGQRVWHITDGAPARLRPVPGAMVLDDASRALIARLHNAGPADQHATADELAAVIARLEQHIVADTALNQFRVRQAIRDYIVARRVTDFAALNAWVYDAAFATPGSDPWLGLLPRTQFTGLPGDGVVMP
jgi:hypothetical protein